MYMRGKARKTHSLELEHLLRGCRLPGPRFQNLTFQLALLWQAICPVFDKTMEVL